MTVLSWLSVLLLFVFLAVFLYWAFREERARPSWVSRGFWGGITVFAALFVVFTVHSMSVMPQRTHEENLSPEVVAGKVAWQKYVCIDCHTILGNGAYYGPDLTKAWDRFQQRTGGDDAVVRAALATYLENPPSATATRRGMTNVRMSVQEAQELAAFLHWISQIDTNGWPAPPLHPVVSAAQLQPTPLMSPLTMQGKELFEKNGCNGCHGLAGVAPDLHGAAARWDHATLVRWLQDTDSIYRERKRKPLNEAFGAMPSMNASPDDANAMAAYVLSLGGKEQ